MNKDLLLQLKTAQEKEQILKDQETALLAKIKDSLDLLKEKRKLYAASIETIKAKIKDEALKEFSLTQKKQLDGGIKIRERDVISYDETEAFAFANKKGMFLQLDKNAFEKVAGSLNLEFVTVEKVAQVTFPKQIKLED